MVAYLKYHFNFDRNYPIRRRVMKTWMSIITFGRSCICRNLSRLPTWEGKQTLAEYENCSQTQLKNNFIMLR